MVRTRPRRTLVTTPATAQNTGRQHGRKAAAIRSLWEELGGSARPTDVRATLGTRGITVALAQVSRLRPAVRDRKRPSGGPVTFQSLVIAKQFADRVGGINAAQAVLDALAKVLN